MEKSQRESTHETGLPAVSAPASSDAVLHELRVHQIELEMQNEALRASQLEVERARDRYLDLFEFAPVGYITLARKATIADVNLTAATLLGIERKKLRGRPFVRLVSSEDRGRWYRYFAKLMHSRDAREVELSLGGSADAALAVRITGLALSESDDGEVARLTLTDVSEKRRLEARLAERVAEVKGQAQALAEAERFARATIDALPSRLCVLDEHGRIIATNKKWRESAEEGVTGKASTECARCLASPRSMPCWPPDTAAAVGRAIDDLIAGEGQSFSIGYECRTEAGSRWFEMRVTRFAGEGPVRLVVIHEEVTERQRAVRAQHEGAVRIKRLGAHLEKLREEQGAMIARELHDELGATLTMLKLGLATLAEDRAGSEADQSRFTQLLGKVDSALKVVKRVSGSLRPATLDTLGLVATIASYAGQFSNSTGIATVLRLPEDIRLSKIGSTTVFRIVQEGLTNAAKHSGADKVTISARKRVSPGGGVLIVRLRDNGTGIAEGERLRHDAFGLIGMQERAQNLGGALAIRSRAGEGTCLSLRIPLDERGGGQ